MQRENPAASAASEGPEPGVAPTVMTRAVALVWLAWLALLVGPLALYAQAAAEWRIEPVAPGVYAALQPEALRFNDSNSAILIGERDVLIVDAQANARSVEALIGEIRKLTELPIRHVVNTHWHGDHTQGNAVYRAAFGGGVSFVGHVTVPADVEERARQALDDDIAGLREVIPRAEEQLAAGLSLGGEPLDDEMQERQRRGIADAKVRLASLEETELLPPDLTFAERLVLRRGAGEIELLHRPGHTRGDIVAYLPRVKVLVTGDLLDDLPFGGHGDLGRWIETLDWMAGLDFEVFIPGHGRVRRGAEARRHLALVRELLTTIEKAVGEAVENGLDLEATRSTIDLASLRERLAGSDELAGRAFDDFVPATIERAFELAAALRSSTPTGED